MKKRTKIFTIAFAVQFVLVMAIVLFPERIKIEKFTDYTELHKPTSVVEYTKTPPNNIRKKISEDNLFSKYNGTRGISVPERKNAIIIITNKKFEESLHFDRIMVEAYNRGIGSVFIDPREAPFYVPILKENGGFYTSKERQQIYIREIVEYMKDIGYRSFSLWTFGDWFSTSVNSILDMKAIKSYSLITNSNYRNMPDSFKIFPPMLIISGEQSDSFDKSRDFYNTLKTNNVQAELIPLINTYDLLVDASGKLDREIEVQIFETSLSWSEKYF